MEANEEGTFFGIPTSTLTIRIDTFEDANEAFAGLDIDLRSSAETWSDVDRGVPGIPQGNLSAVERELLAQLSKVLTGAKKKSLSATGPYTLSWSVDKWDIDRLTKDLKKLGFRAVPSATKTFPGGIRGPFTRQRFVLAKNVTFESAMKKLKVKLTP